MSERYFLVDEVELGGLADVDLLGGGAGLLHLEVAGGEVVAARHVGAGGDLLGDLELEAAHVAVGELGELPGAGRVLAGAVGDVGDRAQAVAGHLGRAADRGGLASGRLDDSEGDAAGRGCYVSTRASCERLRHKGS
jgi:hypothetical protein